MTTEKTNSDEQRALVIIPTYNEHENIQKMIPKVLEQDPRLHVLVVDDNSPDGTAEVVQIWAQKTSRVMLHQRPKKMGLGTAYVEGFKYALANQFDLIFEMDADFSHNPKELPKFLDSIDGYDLVIGSRYIRGVNVVNWPLSRLLLSYFANVYIRFVTGLPVRDATAGYRCYKREVLEAIDLDSIRSDGYAFQIEMCFIAWKMGFRLLEIPIIFVDRFIGVSKMNPGIVKEAIWMVWKIRILAMLGRFKRN